MSRSTPVVLTLAALVGLNAGCPFLNLPGGGGDTPDPNTPDPNMMDPNTPDPTTPPPGDGGLTGRFAGATRCGLCHVNTHDTWGDTLHAGAYQTLMEVGQENNADCLPCHVTGFNESDGWMNMETTASLAGVTCESCHGPAADHANNVVDRTLRPPADLASEVCGQCHVGDSQPHFTQWASSRHAAIDGYVQSAFIDGQPGRLSSCGACHSGDYYYNAILNDTPVADDALAGLPPEALMATECAMCHEPHMQTNNASLTPDGRDFQLRFPILKLPAATNTVAAATDSDRFNLCGQCHHSRGRTWTSNSRGPHHSVQSNVLAGEMPMPEADGDVPIPLVDSRVSVHADAPTQCAACHLPRVETPDDPFAPTLSQHTFAATTQNCTLPGCHTSVEQAAGRQGTLQSGVTSALARIEGKLGDASTWQYSATGGPSSDDQSAIPENIRKARFLISYVEADGSLGMHNPDYTRDILAEAERLVDESIAAGAWPL